MKIIGITGGAGAGKSQILAYLNERYGASVCQADEVARGLQKKGKQCYNQIVEYFGTDILDSKGELNRDKLAATVFADDKEMAVLESIVHPVVKEEIKKIIKKEEKKNTGLFILEAALLIEDHYDRLCDELWYVYAEDSVRRNRLIYARNYDAGRVDDIFAAQLSKKEFLRHCDRVVDNSGLFEETKLQLDEIIRKLES